jgi:GNAT superfamily N-acetyltransferase
MLIRRIQTLDEVQKAHALEMICYTPEAAASLAAFHLRKEIFPCYFLLALNNEAIVGIVNGIRTNDADLSNEALKQTGDYDKNGRYLCILTLAVHPVFRGLHIGHELMSGIIQQAWHDKLYAIVLMCERHLIHFYEKLGFQYVQPSSSLHGGIEWHEMRLDCPA